MASYNKWKHLIYLATRLQLFFEPMPYDGVSSQILSFNETSQEFLSSDQVNLWEATGTVMQMLSLRSNIQFRLD